MKYIKFQDKNGSFSIENPENYSGLYIPLAGENGLKSAITPSLGGDSKLDQNHFLLEPVSIENLHNNRNTRNFWCKIKRKRLLVSMRSSAEQEFQKYTDKQDKKQPGSRIYVAEDDKGIQKVSASRRNTFFYSSREKRLRSCW